MEYELYHHGIKGMRWGIRRFQNKNGGLTPAGKKRYSDDADTTEEETIEQKKARVMSSHDAKTVYKNKELLSDKELQEAYIRLNMERNIKNLIPEEKSRGKKFVESLNDTGKTIKSVVDTADDLYKSYEKGKKLLDTILKTASKVG